VAEDWVAVVVRAGGLEPPQPPRLRPSNPPATTATAVECGRKLCPNMARNVADPPNG
jgi:hypothetical protein